MKKITKALISLSLSGVLGLSAMPVSAGYDKVELSSSLDLGERDILTANYDDYMSSSGTVLRLDDGQGIAVHDKSNCYITLFPAEGFEITGRTLPTIKPYFFDKAADGSVRISCSDADEMKKLLERAKLMQIEGLVRNACACAVVDFGSIDMYSCDENGKEEYWSAALAIPQKELIVYLSNEKADIDAVRDDGFTSTPEKNAELEKDIKYLYENDPYTYAVTGVSDDSYMLGNDVMLWKGSFKLYSGTDRELKYGDIVRVKNIDGILETFPAQLEINDETKMEYLGNIADVYSDSTRELILEKKKNDYTFVFIDPTTEGRTEYKLNAAAWSEFRNHGYTPYFDTSALNVGDRVKCAVMGYNEIFPLSIENTSAEKAFNAIVVGVEGDTYFLDCDCRLEQIIFEEYSGSSKKLSYGDVVKVSGVDYFLVTYPAQFPITDDTRMEYMGNISDIYSGSTKELTLKRRTAEGYIIFTDGKNEYTWKTKSKEMLRDLGYRLYCDADRFKTGDKVKCAVISPETVIPIAETGFVLGDSNLDGVLNIRDSAYIAQRLSGRAALTDEADYNKDGKKNVRDAAAIARSLSSK